MAKCPPPAPEVVFTPASLTASAVDGVPGASFRTAGNATITERTYSLVYPCDFTDPRQGGCLPGNVSCPDIPGRIVTYYYVLSQRLVQPDGREISGLAPPAGVAPGTPYGPQTNEGGSCVDVTELNPPPSPDEVFRYLQVLPLPELTLHQQPPGNGLAGLPVIFYTDRPTTQAFTVTIRGFTVDIRATATGYTWHTGDGTTLTSTDPGAPYPHHTVTHDYRAGTYTASLTTTWGASYTVNGGPPITVPGSTTTEGEPVTFTVVQARAVLTNPYD